MTYMDDYRENKAMAEVLLRDSSDEESWPRTGPEYDACRAQALVHATLAVAAAKMATPEASSG